jgi:hypothetical protein
LRYVDKGEAHFEIGLSCLQEKEMWFRSLLSCTICFKPWMSSNKDNISEWHSNSIDAECKSDGDLWNKQD